MGSRRAIALAAVLVASFSTAASGQDSAFVLVDRIVAVVGETPISLRQIDEELNMLRARGSQVPTDSVALAELRRDILSRVVDDELIVQAAQRDTAIQVTDQDVQSAVEEAVREIRSQFASELEYQRQLRASGFGTPEEYRRWLSDQKRSELLGQALLQQLQQQGELAPLPPTEAELRAFYEETRAQQPRRPATVSFRQIVIRPQPDTSAVVAAALRADSVLYELRNGGDFETLARRYSDDPGTRDQGGRLGWVRRGRLVPEFEAVAFRLRPGVVSNPVYTPFGFHLIEVERSQPAEVQVRHILIAPEITDQNQANARERADRVVAALRAGAPPDSLSRVYHDQLEDALLDDVNRANLPPMYSQVLANAQPGDVVGPVELDQASGRVKFAVILFGEARPEGETSFEDLREALRRRLADVNAMERYLESLRASTYVDIRLNE